MAISTASSNAKAAPKKYLTVAEFCERFGISRWLYYKMRANGDGPVELRIGSRKIVITVEAMRTWENERTRRPS